MVFVKGVTCIVCNSNSSISDNNVRPVMLLWQGFVEFRIGAQPLHLDVDTLNERLKVQGANRMRHAMRPDEAFGMIFSLDNVIIDTRQMQQRAWQRVAREEGLALPSIERHIYDMRPERAITEVCCRNLCFQVLYCYFAWSPALNRRPYTYLSACSMQQQCCSNAAGQVNHAHACWQLRTHSLQDALNFQPELCTLHHALRVSVEAQWHVQILQWTRDWGTAQQLGWRVASAYVEECSQGNEAMDGAREWLQALATSKVPCALVSSMGR